LGQVSTLSSQAVEKLAAMRRQVLEGQGRDLCEGCSLCVLGDQYQLPGGTDAADEAALVDRIARAVLNQIVSS
jgi:hypothetical protein